MLPRSRRAARRAGASAPEPRAAVHGCRTGGDRRMKVHEIDVHPALPERLAWLGEIARNVWSSWSPGAADLFARLDPEGWERLGHNSVALLRRLPQERLD